MNIFTRRKALIEALGVSALIWLGVAVALFLRPPHPWPWNRPGKAAVSREDVALFCWIVQFLLVKAWLMWARTRWRFALGLSLIAVNAVFALVYLAALAFIVWPVLATEELRQLIRALLAVTVTWAVVQLTLSEDITEGPESPWVLVDALRMERDAKAAQIAALELQVQKGVSAP